jgi:hypothetical protein
MAGVRITVHPQWDDCKARRRFLTRWHGYVVGGGGQDWHRWGPWRWLVLALVRQEARRRLRARARHGRDLAREINEVKP